MQPISDGMRAALTAPAPVFGFGVDLLDGQDRPVVDLSEDVESFTVEHRQRDVEVHGTCDMVLLRDLAWGVDRVRPWITVRADETSEPHRWNLGVFLLTTPETVAGKTPRARSVSGMDKLWLLQRQVGDTYVVPAGVSYLDAVRFALADAGVTGRLMLQGDRQDTPLSEAAVFVLTEAGGYTWLEAINALLGMIAYNPLWVDQDGAFRSEPYVDPAQRAPGWVFDTADPATTMEEDRSLSADVYGLPNRWRFVRNKDRALTADDVYVVDRSVGLPVEQVRPRTVFLDVEDRAALVSEGDRLVAEDTQNTRIVSVASTPLPHAHADVVTVRDPELGLNGSGLVAQWSVSVDGNGARMGAQIEVL